MNIEVKICPQLLINFATLCHHRGCLGQAGLSRLCPTPGNKAPWLGPRLPLRFFFVVVVFVTKYYKKNKINKYCHNVFDCGLEEEKRPGRSMRLRLLGLLQSCCLSVCLLPLWCRKASAARCTTSGSCFQNKSLTSGFLIRLFPFPYSTI